ncbi:hypothetical protein B0H10DRAFT_2047828 [Mycena sp. CBHHK59/15]|nr:hypothetical protein B0H10DRAFT_2047828 [Mycena sp. CBHHK59/15]
MSHVRLGADSDLASCNLLTHIPESPVTKVQFRIPAPVPDHSTPVPDRIKPSLSAFTVSLPISPRYPKPICASGSPQRLCDGAVLGGQRAEFVLL